MSSISRLQKLIKDPSFRRKLQEMVAKAKEQKSGGGTGLHDRVNLKATGRLHIDLFDTDGNVIETYEQEDKGLNAEGRRHLC